MLFMLFKSKSFNSVAVVTRMDGIREEHERIRTGVVNALVYIVQTRDLKWCRHIERMEEER